MCLHNLKHFLLLALTLCICFSIFYLIVNIHLLDIKAQLQILAIVPPGHIQHWDNFSCLFPKFVGNCDHKYGLCTSTGFLISIWLLQYRLAVLKCLPYTRLDKSRGNIHFTMSVLHSCQFEAPLLSTSLSWWFYHWFLWHLDVWVAL